MEQRIRRHLLFVLAFFVTAGTLAVATFLFRNLQPFFLQNKNESAQSFVDQFTQTHVTGNELNLTAMYTGSGQFQILHPSFDVKSLHLKTAGSTCSSESGGPQNFVRCDEEINKQRDYYRILWHELPATDDFVLNPPFIDESGNSYALELLRNEIAPYNSESWVQEHLSFFKPNELKEVFRRFPIRDSSFTTMAQLSNAEVKALAEGAPLVMTANSVLIKNQSHLGFSPLSYWVYDLNEFKNQLKDKDFDLVGDANDNYCLEKIGNACWTYSSKAAMGYVARYSTAIVDVIALLFFVLLAFSIKHVVDKNREQQRHRTSLQVLSHEFRTPVASMLLMLEELRRNLPRFEENDQDLVTKISSEAYRLQRIIEMSKTYLQSTEGKRFHPVRIASINTWISEFAFDFDSRIHCELLKSDREFLADPFWLRFVLSNLVQNAFAHGKEPVRIRLTANHKSLQIEVEDQGACEFESLQKMTEAFTKSRQSQGMGLGLNITKAIVQDWGGTLKFRKSPTSFSFTFDQNHSGQQL